MANTIKIKRGLKNNLPSLSDGELGYTTDTNELYIGNSGNVKVNDGKTYTFASGDSNGTIKVTPSGESAQNISVTGLGASAYKGVSSSISSSSTNDTVSTAKAVNDFVVAQQGVIPVNPSDTSNINIWIETE